jgi:hypothetical protein
MVFPTGQVGWKQEADCGFAVSMHFKPQITCEWGKIWAVLVGQGG